MSITYYYTALSETTSESKEYRLFAIIDNSWYWAIEWSYASEQAPAVLTDFNTGFMSKSVRNSVSRLATIEPAELRSQFGTFGDYIERAVSGFRSYITWICPDPEMKNVIWQITET